RSDKDHLRLDPQLLSKRLRHGHSPAVALLPGAGVGIARVDHYRLDAAVRHMLARELDRLRHHLILRENCRRRRGNLRVNNRQVATKRLDARMRTPALDAAYVRDVLY